MKARRVEQQQSTLIIIVYRGKSIVPSMFYRRSDTDEIAPRIRVTWYEKKRKKETMHRNGSPIQTVHFVRDSYTTPMHQRRQFLGNERGEGEGKGVCV